MEYWLRVIVFSVFKSCHCFLSATKLFPDNPWEVPAEEETTTKYFPDKPWNVPTGDIDSDE